MADPPSKRDILCTFDEELQAWGRNPRLATRVLSNLARRRRPDVAELLLECMQAQLVEVNVFHCSSLMTAYEKVGQWQAALCLLSRMPAMAAVPDVISYNAAISSCGKGCQWKWAMNLLSCMLSVRISPNQISYCSAITACARGGQWQLALSLLNRMPAVRLDTNEVSHSAAISACERGGQWELALSLLMCMPAARIVPDEISYSATISACEKGGQWQLALGLLSQMPAAQLLPTKFSYSAAISACEKGGQWGFALTLLSRMPAAKASPDVVSYSAAISACEKAGEWQLALGLLARMPAERVAPNQISFSAAISACEKGGQWQLALSLLGQMPTMKVVPDRISYSATISACDKGGQWNFAVSLLGLMSAARVPPDATTYGTAASACERDAQWQAALGIVAAMRDDQLEPNGIMWGSVLSSMAKAGGSDGAPRLLEDLRLKWADKVPECPPLDGVLLPGRSPQAASAAVLGRAPGIVALCKPSGVTSEQMQEALAAAIGHEVSLVSRLDAPTSGVLPLALGDSASPCAQWLHAQFASRTVAKEYLCLCLGRSLGSPGLEGDIDTPLLVRGGGHGGQRAVLSPLGKEARTHYKVLEVYRLPDREDVLTLLEVNPRTGRTHQIRAHLAGIGRALVGDEAYGGIGDLGIVRFARLFLHCRRLSLVDLAGCKFRPEAPLPDELQEMLSALRRRSSTLGEDEWHGRLPHGP